MTVAQLVGLATGFAVAATVGLLGAFELGARLRRRWIDGAA